MGTFDGELQDINVGGTSVDMVDITEQASTDEWREFKAGLKDGGEVTLTVSYDPDCTDPPVEGEDVATLKIAWPTGTTLWFEAAAIVQGISVSAPLGQKIVCDITLKITGAVDWAGAA